MKKYNHLPLVSGALYLLSLIICVAYAWISDIHRFDLGISFSAYVGLQRWTSVMYFIFAMIMVSLMAVYTAKTKIPLIKKLIYALIFISILGTAFFPFNTFSDAPTNTSIDMHNNFGIFLMFATTVSFIFSIITSKSVKHKITAAISLAYAAVFIAMYNTGISILLDNFFIAENIFIILLFLEVYMERYEDR